MKNRLIFVVFDSLVRDLLGAYGGTDIPTPNFDRFSKKAVTFNNHWAGSLPCMPARREMHTGRLNFLHRGWGPVEPYDVSVFEVLKEHGVYSHLITDHFHYFEDGGATYHSRYNTWEYVRGQECDKWIPVVKPPIEGYRSQYNTGLYDLPAEPKKLMHCINRERIKSEGDFPLVKCFEQGIDFLETNKDSDNWLLQIECFDPHEPFFASKEFRELAGVDESAPISDWPRYGASKDNESARELLQKNYSALLRMCDHYFGKLLDYMDTHGLWSNTSVILTTDHGFLLGEHEMWAKNRTPHYNEIARIPLMIYTPACEKLGGRYCNSLTQTIDIAPTILEYFDQNVPLVMTGKSLIPLLKEDVKIREVAIYGIFGGSLNITDGRFTYFLYPEEISGEGLYEYTVMPCHMNRMFPSSQLCEATLSPAFNFTQGVPLLRIPALKENQRTEIGRKFLGAESALYDLSHDEMQRHPVIDASVTSRLRNFAKQVFEQHAAPAELYKRFNLF